ncbi:MAG: hypothetical protein KGJ07_02430 [Patescibacteria group bacterium]|nr:hypothetical protein [Patescibacteria group bacterium]MDE2589349.1 hypothetical protein [Patescibacteria group bacterium]
MLPQEVRIDSVLNPGISSVGLPLSPDFQRKSLFTKPTVERDGFAIHPAAPNREQLISDRVSYIGTPPTTYEGLVEAYEHNLLDGIDPREWNATVTYYTTARSMENLAKSAREEFGLNLASMWPMARIFSKTMRSVQTNLEAHGFTDAQTINPDDRKNMQAGIYKARQQAAVRTPQAREDRRQRILAEPKGNKRRQRASETLKRQRKDPEFLAKLLAAEPTRKAHITKTWRLKTGHLDMEVPRQTQSITPVILDTIDAHPISSIPSIIEPIPDTQEMLVVKQLITIDSVQRQVLIAQTFGEMQAFHEQGLLAIVTGQQLFEEFTPFMQGFLLMKRLAEAQGAKVTLSPVQGENLARKLSNKVIAAKLIAYAQTDQRLFAEFVNLAHTQFALPEDVDPKTLGERTKQKIRQNKLEFLYGIAVMYFLASHAEKNV